LAIVRPDLEVLVTPAEDRQASMIEEFAEGQPV
jgi:hypothetical protein